MNNKYIFPYFDIRFERGIGINDLLTSVVFNTWIRKKYRGKYYLWEVTRRFEYRDGVDPMVILKDQQIFFSEVYNVIMFGKVNPKMMKQYFGRTVPFFELDPNQDPEENRLLYIKKSYE